MKKLLYVLLIVGSISPLAMGTENRVSFRCKDKTIDSCKERVLKELELKACMANVETLECKQEPTDNNMIYCQATAIRCSSASSDGLSGVNCKAGEIKRINDKYLTADWARTILWIWVKDMCINI